MGDDTNHLKRVLDAFDGAVLSASDEDIQAGGDSIVAGNVIAAVLKGYKLQEGSNSSRTWNRGRSAGLAPVRAASSIRKAVNEPLRASFSSGNEEGDSDGDDLES
jgi:hypothetical protein